MDDTLHLGEEGIVAADAHVSSWLEPRPPLPDEDAAPGDDLARKGLHPQAPPRAVPTVP